MKKFISIFILILVVVSVTACGTSFSKSDYQEISDFVLENERYIPHTKTTEFYVHKTMGEPPNTVYCGYYFSESDEIAIADFYTRGKLGKESQSNGGTYFGKPNGGTDWYFTKKITDNWYYFELHQID